MAKLKEFIFTHKKTSIGISAAVLLSIFLVCFAMFFMENDSSKDKKNEDEVSFKDWDNLIADLEEEPVSELDEVYKDPSSDKEKKYKISINKTQNYITILGKDRENKYTKVIKYMVCSAGFDTPTGTFSTSDKYTWKIVNGNVWAQYATRVEGNVLIHSMPYQSKDKGTLLPNYYNQLGRTLSAGCVRVSAGDSEWILKNCPRGTVVEIYESDEIPVNFPASIKVPDNAAWDPTDSDDANPWKSIVLEFNGLENIKNIERGTQFDYMEGVTILDTCGNDISSQVKVTTEMDVFNPGTYNARYEVMDATGKTAQKDVTFQVQDTTPPKLCGLMDTIYFSSAASVTKESVLKGVTMLDNNQIIPLDTVQVVLPPIAEGPNQVTITAADSYQNVTTKTITVIVDSKPPTVKLKDGMKKTIPLKQVVDKAYAISRIEASDEGIPVEESQINVSIRPKLWGYTLHYKVYDKQGNVAAFQDEINYIDYEIIPSGNLNVTDITDRSQLLEGVVLKTSDGNTEAVDDIKYTVVEQAGGKYQITYSYSFSCPLGSKTITATDTFTIKSVATPTPTPDESETPEMTPANSYRPQVSSAPPAITNKP